MRPTPDLDTATTWLIWLPALSPALGQGCPACCLGCPITPDQIRVAGKAAAGGDYAHDQGPSITFGLTGSFLVMPWHQGTRPEDALSDYRVPSPDPDLEADIVALSEANPKGMK